MYVLVAIIDQSLYDSVTDVLEDKGIKYYTARDSEQAAYHLNLPDFDYGLVLADTFLEDRLWGPQISQVLRLNGHGQQLVGIATSTERNYWNDTVPLLGPKELDRSRIESLIEDYL